MPMTLSKAAFYTHLLRQPRHDQNHVVFSRRCRITCTVGLLLFLTIVYIFWPSDPDLKIVRLKLKRIKVHRMPRITVDISMLLTLRVHNADVYYMDFGAVDVAVGYRGKGLGHVRLEHGHVRARGSSYVDADVEFAGISVLPEMVLLLEDLAKGTVPFDTVSQVRGQLGLLFFHFPMKVLADIYGYSFTCRKLLNEYSCGYKGENESGYYLRGRETGGCYLSLPCPVAIPNLLRRQNYHVRFWSVH